MPNSQFHLNLSQNLSQTQISLPGSLPYHFSQRLAQIIILETERFRFKTGTYTGKTYVKNHARANTRCEGATNPPASRGFGLGLGRTISSSRGNSSTLVRHQSSQSRGTCLSPDSHAPSIVLASSYSFSSRFPRTQLICATSPTPLPEPGQPSRCSFVREGPRVKRRTARDKFVTRPGPDRDFVASRYRLQILEKILDIFFPFFFFLNLGLLVEYRFRVSFVSRDYFFEIEELAVANFESVT